LWIYNNWPGFRFRNNIFVYKGPFLYQGQKLVDELFQGNCFWNLSGDQTIAGYEDLDSWARATGNEMLDGNLLGIFTDPLLQNPGTCFLTDPRQLNSVNLEGYCLKEGSPLIDHGLDLKKLFNLEPGTRDIAGTILYKGSGIDVGAIEYVK
jgi:hypothetical protein